VFALSTATGIAADVPRGASDEDRGFPGTRARGYD
jgi:hypothetical protein